MSRFLEKKPDPKDQAFLDHLKSLGLNSLKDYQRWCKEQGFSDGIYKNENLRKKEIAKLKENKLAQAMEKNKDRLKPLDLKISKALKSKTPKDIIDSDPQLKSLFSEIPTMEQKSLDSFLEFISLVSKKSKITKELTLLKALWKVFQNKDSWIQDLNSWQVQSKNIHKQFSHLLRYLFSKYKLPEFLDSSWFSDKNDKKPIEWFLWIAQGNNIRKANKLPFELTKMMAHEFLNSPSNYNIYQGLRYGQILGMGGDARLAQMINETFLGRDFNLSSSQQDFWTSVINFFIQNPMLDRFQVGPIIDFLQFQKFSINAPQPGLSMKGRNPQILLEQVEAWHKQLQRSRGKNYKQWESSGVPEFFKEEKSSDEISKIWEIIELKNSKDLDQEGKSMRHCVGSYAHSCINKRCAIFSVRHQGEKMGTVEVYLSSKSIVQARGKANILLGGKTKQIIYEWAGRAGLGISCSFKT